MKKISVLMIIIILAVACSSPTLDKDSDSLREGHESTQTNTFSNESVKETENQSKVEDSEKEENQEFDTKDEFILSTFQEYGVDVSLDQLIIKEEGNSKTVVIYKDFTNSKKPHISKLIFGWIDKSNYEIYHITIKNRVIKH